MKAARSPSNEGIGLLYEHEPIGGRTMSVLSRAEAASKIMVALDRPDAAAALALADRLQGSGIWVKVGMELFYAAGPSIVRELKSRGFRIFLDLKMHDIPNTVRGGARSITRL